MTITAITSNPAGNNPITGDFAALLTPVQADSVPAYQYRLQGNDPDHQNHKPVKQDAPKTPTTQTQNTGGHSHYPKVMPASGRPL